MTREISDIVAAFREARKAGRKTALATVVHVEGSSYRRPGARMLVEDNGRMTGAISGGCLEGDALRKALWAMSTGQNRLVTYDTLDPDDVVFGVQLGCNGIVHILFEPIDPEQIHNPVSLLEQCMQTRQEAVLVTVFSLKNFQALQPGTCLLFDGSDCHGRGTDTVPDVDMRLEAALALTSRSSQLREHGGFMVFSEWLQSPVSLVIVGAGNDAMPLVEMASVLGWQITLIDGRATHATSQRFPKAHRIIVGKPAEALDGLYTDARTVFVLMTHNYHYDLVMLGYLLQRTCCYIGALGPKKRLERMLTSLQDQGRTISPQQRAVIYGPAGLDIGAEAPEEIALSIISEIKSVLAGHGGGMLRDRTDPIHRRAEVPAENIHEGRVQFLS